MLHNRFSPLPAFEECFTRWIADTFRAFSGDGLDVIPINGKCLRGSRTKSKKAIHMVSAWSTREGMVLCQREVDEKSNEITAAPELLKSFCLKGLYCPIPVQCSSVLRRSLPAGGGSDPVMTRFVGRSK